MALEIMTLATLKENGQVTIPKQIRETLHLHSGDNVEITLRKKRLTQSQPAPKQVDEVFYRLHQAGRKPVSLEQMDNAIRCKIINTTFQTCSLPIPLKIKATAAHLHLIKKHQSTPLFELAQ